MTLEEMEAKIKEIEENNNKKLATLEEEYKKKLEEKDKTIEEVKKKQLEIELIQKGEEFKDDIPEEEEIKTWENLFKDKTLEDFI